MSSYATKAELKNTIGVDTSKIAANSDLGSLKAEDYKIDLDKLKTFPADLSQLSNVGKNEVVKKTVYDKLVARVSNIDTSGFVLKTKYDTDKLNLEKKIPDTSGLVKKTNYNAKISEVESKIRNISGLTTTFALTTVGNKIPDISGLVKIQIIMQKLVKLKRKLLEKKITDHY